MEKLDLDLLHVLEHSPLATAIYDSPDMRIAFVNKAMLDMWCATSDIVGQCFGDVFPGFKKEGFASILENVWSSGITYSAKDTPAYILNGTEKHLHYFDFEYKALVDELGLTYAILHTSTDVTQRFLAEKENINHREMSFNSDLETLTYTLSHDVKNPLSVAKMGINYLLNEGDTVSHTHYTWYKTILDALLNIETIVDQTVKLSATRLLTNKQQLNHLTDYIPGWINEAKLSYNANNTAIQYGQLLPVFGDIGALYQIFINIITNAVKYSVCVTKPVIEIFSEQTDGGVVYFIKDNGIGIPEKEMERVFCAFKRASNVKRQEGSGIGLCLTRRIIERFSGTINVSSKEGVGTLVRLYFPQSTDQKAN